MVTATQAEQSLPLSLIRPATEDDFGLCLAMAEVFWKHTCYTDPFERDHVRSMIELAHDHKLLIVYDVEGTVQGFVAGLAIPLLGNASVTQVSELAYWINPAHRGNAGLALLRGLEQAAELIGAKYINMIAMESSAPDMAEAIYRSQGYYKIETTYCKELGV